MLTDCREVYEKNSYSSGFEKSFTTESISFEFRCELRVGLGCITNDALPDLTQLLDVAIRHTIGSPVEMSHAAKKHADQRLREEPNDELGFPPQH